MWRFDYVAGIELPREEYTVTYQTADSTHACFVQLVSFVFATDITLSFSSALFSTISQ